jgi:undecaprenyl diphosphate synthase
MDGNGRWAKKRLMPRLHGHKQGVIALQKCVEACLKRHLPILTVFAFSRENWGRPSEEVKDLFGVIAQSLLDKIPYLQDSKVRVRFLGDLEALNNKALLQGLKEAEKITRYNQDLLLNVCLNYSGRWDIVQASRQLVTENIAISESSLDKALLLADIPKPDLLIRTGNEQRISNFLLWQIAYTELYFSRLMWPDFDESELDRAITAFSQRERRFGKTSDQVNKETLDV